MSRIRALVHTVIFSDLYFCRVTCYYTGKCLAQRWVLSCLSYFSYSGERFTSAVVRKCCLTVTVLVCDLVFVDSLMLLSVYQKENKCFFCKSKIAKEGRGCFHFTCPLTLIFFKHCKLCLSLQHSISSEAFPFMIIAKHLS